MNIGHFPGPLFMKAISKMARNGYRTFMDPEQYAPDIGFRCVSGSLPKAVTGSKNPFGGTASSKGNPGAFDAGSGDQSTSSLSKGFGGSNPFQPKSSLPQSGILVLILISFLAGLFSFLSPCTLPILPAYFAVTAQAERKNMSMMSVAFFIGLATLFVLMGASASVIGSLLRDYLFEITKIGGILVMLFGVLTLFGMGFSGASFRQHPGSSFFGFFLFGATFALGWTPCVGPILSGILILAASDKTMLQAMSLLFAYAVGLGFPLILIATFFSHLKKDGLFWKILRGKAWDIHIGSKTIALHTTNVFSGLLLIFLGVVLAMGYMTYINSIIPLEIQIWFSEYEEKMLHLFM